MEFSSKLNLGNDLGKNDYSMVISSSDNFLNINIVASRTTEIFSRSYDTVLDLFGNIGGSVEFLIILFTLLFNWYENLSSTLIMRRALATKFNLPQRYVSSDSVFSLCRWRRRKEDRDLIAQKALDQIENPHLTSR